VLLYLSENRLKCFHCSLQNLEDHNLKREPRSRPDGTSRGARNNRNQPECLRKVRTLIEKIAPPSRERGISWSASRLKGVALR
jgi:hypothetical protein